MPCACCRMLPQPGNCRIITIEFFIQIYLLSGGKNRMGGPTLQIIDPSGIFLADLFAFMLSLPVALFLAFWMSDVKNRVVVVLGAVLGAFLALLIILGCVGTLLHDPVL